jgi:hypothetical protein
VRPHVKKKPHSLFFGGVVVHPSTVHIVGTGMPGPGRLGNRVFQAGLALRIGKALGRPVVFSGFHPGPLLPEMGDEHPTTGLALMELSVEECNSSTLTEITDRYDNGDFQGIHLKGWGTGIENVIDLRGQILKRLEELSPQHHAISDDEVLLSLRLGDIAGKSPNHPDYYPPSRFFL